MTQQTQDIQETVAAVVDQVTQDAPAAPPAGGPPAPGRSVRARDADRVGKVRLSAVRCGV